MNNNSEPSVVDLENFDAHAAEFIANPYPSYRWFRENQPVAWIEKDYQSYWVFRHEDVKQVLANSDIWVKDVAEEGVKPKPGLTKSLFASDGLRHTQLRGLLGPIFRESIKDLDSAASAIADGLVPETKPGDEFNFISDYAHPLPSRSLAHVLGIKSQAWSKIEPLVQQVVLANDPAGGKLVKGVGAGAMLTMRLGALAAAFAEEHDLLTVALQALLEVPGQLESGKMVSLMLELAEKSNDSEIEFTLKDVSANAVSLAIAGYFTSTHLLGTGLTNLLNHPESLAAVQEACQNGTSSEIMPGVVNEMLRFDAPIHLIDRIANETTELAGVTIERGQKIALVVGSANRDEAAFSDPDTFDIYRDSSEILSFGYGIHQCLGAQMLKQVLPIALNCLFTRFPSFELAREPSYQPDPCFRGFTELQLRFK